MCVCVCLCPGGSCSEVYRVSDRWFLGYAAFNVAEFTVAGSLFFLAVVVLLLAEFPGETGDG